ncbi:flavin reductase family protein [Streptomyces sp. PSKA01]|uniref:Flavin reductase family protein n=2 Tax=Streptomyces cupreus TaxID=2759956 RepID=A0A7X1J9B8_9ACTN|nr:flavin reductase family protein [Streptomyces cupreus]
MTCSALCSVTGTPPTLLVCLRRENPTLDAIVRCGRFAVTGRPGWRQPCPPPVGKPPNDSTGPIP